MKKLLLWLKKHLGSSSGFTLVELLVVIAILGVLAAVLIVLIDPVDKVNAANDAGVINTQAQIGGAQEVFGPNNNNGYAATLADLVTNGEIKSAPAAPTNYAYYFFTSNSKTAFGACTTAAQTCQSSFTATTLRSKKYTGSNTGTNVSYYMYRDGKGCVKTNVAVPTAATVFANPGITCP